jgi:hypothetical protein
MKTQIRASSGKRQPSSGGDRPRHVGDIPGHGPVLKFLDPYDTGHRDRLVDGGRTVRLFMNDEFGNTVIDPLPGGARQSRTPEPHGTVENGNLEDYEITPCEHDGRSRRAGTGA